MVPARNLIANSYYGKLPMSEQAMPYDSHEPKPLGTMRIPVSTLKNPNGTDMWADNGVPSNKAEYVATIKGFKGWGLAK